MTNTDHNTDEAVGRTRTLLEYLSSPEPNVGDEKLGMVRLGVEPAVLSLFTSTVLEEEVHYLRATETWAGGYVRCCGEGCPACRAEIDRKKNLLLPVLDRIDGRVKVLRVAVQRGPGKLLTELGKVLSVEEPSRLIVRVVRGRDYNYTVTIQSEVDLDPECTAAVKSFVAAQDAGAVDIRDVARTVSQDELATHEEIAARLRFMGA